MYTSSMQHDPYDVSARMNILESTCLVSSDSIFIAKCKISSENCKHIFVRNFSRINLMHRFKSFPVQISDNLTVLSICISTCFSITSFSELEKFTDIFSLYFTLLCYVCRMDLVANRNVLSPQMLLNALLGFINESCNFL